MEIGRINSNSSFNGVGSGMNDPNTVDRVGKVETEDNAATNHKEEEISQHDLQKSIDIANKALFKNNTHLQFRIHEKTKGVMVKIINDETGEVVKEIPPEKMQDLVAKLWEIAGILIDEKR